MYDGTPFLKNHPGGSDSILIVAGQDASDEFDAIHSSKAKAMLEEYYIGELAPGERAIRRALSPETWGCVRLGSRDARDEVLGFRVLQAIRVPRGRSQGCRGKVMNGFPVPPWSHCATCWHVDIAMWQSDERFLAALLQRAQPSRKQPWQRPARRTRQQSSWL